MTDRFKDRAELTREFQLVPDLGTAITTWHLARHRFQNERQKEYQEYPSDERILTVTDC